MRKGALLLALAFAIAGTTTASAAKKMAKPDPAVEAQKNSSAFIHDALFPWGASATPKAKGKKKK